MTRETITKEYDESGHLIRTTHSVEITHDDAPVSHTEVDERLGWRYDPYTDSFVPLVKKIH